MKKKLTKKELSEWLLTCGITMKRKLADLQRAASNHGLPIKEISQKAREGWEGKPKGLLQVLWERGWVDNINGGALNYYTISGRKSKFNLVQPKTSLKHLMASCCDFEEEDTMLQSMASLMGVDVDRSPKCHCKIAGEGIEFSWACVKNHYQQILLDKKRGKENFLKKHERKCVKRSYSMRGSPKVCTEGKALYRWIPHALSDAARINSKPGQSGTAGQQQNTHNSTSKARANGKEVQNTQMCYGL